MPRVEKAGTIVGVLAIVAGYALATSVVLVGIGVFAHVVWICILAGWNVVGLIF